MHTVPVRNEALCTISPVQFGYEACKKSKFFGPAVRTHWLIHFVVSGFGSYTIGNKKYPVGPGEMFVIPPWEVTFYEADDQNPWSYIWVGFLCDGELPQRLDPVISCPSAPAVFLSMKKCENMTTGRNEWLCAKIWELFSVLDTPEGKRKDYVEQALERIHSEYVNPITIDEISAELGLERTYFSALFKKKMGISPKKYLLGYRMSIALKLMTENGESVSVAANSVGYNDIYTFSKMFKRTYGLSPTEYIKNNFTE